MNCSEWEERLALYWAGDLDAEEAVRTQRHLAECPGCQVFLSGLKSGLHWLQEAHSEEPSPAHFAAVRARVLGELRAERQPFWRRKLLYGLAAAALLLAWTAGLRLQTPGPPAVALSRPPVVAQALAAPPVRESVMPAPGADRPVLSRHPRLVKTEPVMVRVVTDNPDVVIYWIADKKGE